MNNCQLVYTTQVNSDWPTSFPGSLMLIGQFGGDQPSTIHLRVAKEKQNDFCAYIVTISILIGQEPPAYFENSRDFVNKHDHSIICYPIMSADYTARSVHAQYVHLWLKSANT